IAGDILIKVPDSLELITPYVLREQEKWFEDEIGFVRQVLQRGARVIDVGANYGVYTLLMAKAVGDQGQVWAFEPATSTVRCLQDSVSLNRFKNVTVIHAALSDRMGKAHLRLDRNSELNSLISKEGALSEEVRLTTLDCSMSEFELKKIEFLKLDAEGEEKNILTGGRELLLAESPLIMFELKHGNAVNVGLISRFAELGYSTYRLIPGLNLLAPFGHDDSPDPFLLNLFCCKDDRAVELENAGWLVRQSQGPDVMEREGYDTWENALYSLPFAQRLREQWQRLPKQGDETYLKAIELYFLAHADSRTSYQRYHALQASFNRLKQISGTGQKLTYLSTFARIAAEMGYRAIAVETVVKQWEILSKTRHAPLDEPFLPVCSRFDHLDPGNRPIDWFLGSLLEAYETRHALSSYYTGQSSLGDLEVIKGLGFQSPEMERRRQLIRMRYGMQLRPSSSSLLSKKMESNLNPEFWSAVD
ncbi:MAG: FkbM family methyltransferase, partial [Dehalococcoidia bacterium]|nr:FkbM family methyltransferase [Dehalococcoidia bacterium]